MSYLVRVIYGREITEEADVVVRVPSCIKPDSDEFHDYISEMAYDIANEQEAWKVIGVEEQDWSTADLHNTSNA